MRVRLRSRLKELLERIDVRIERTPPKDREAQHGKARQVYVTIKFRSGAVRRIWFETGGGVYGLWTPTNTVPGDDLSHLTGLMETDRPA